MGFGTCDGCWDNPCTCGKQYAAVIGNPMFFNTANKAKRMEIAAAALGMPIDHLAKLLGDNVSERHIHDILGFLRDLERFPQLDEFVVDPKDRELGDPPPIVPIPYVSPRSQTKKMEEILQPLDFQKLLHLCASAEHFTEKFIFPKPLGVRRGDRDEGALRTLAAYGYTVRIFYAPGLYYHGRVTISLKDKNYVFVVC